MAICSPSSASRLQGFTGTTALVSPEVFVPLNAYGLVMNDFDGHVGPLAARDNPALIVVGRLKPGLTSQAADCNTGGDGVANGEGLSRREQGPGAAGATAGAPGRLHQPAIRQHAQSAGDHAAFARRRGAADRLLEPGEYDDGQRDGAAQGNRDPVGHWRQPPADCPAIGHGRIAAGDSGRRGGPGDCFLEHTVAHSIDGAAGADRDCLRPRAGRSRAGIHAVVLHSEHGGFRAFPGLEALEAGRVAGPQEKYW